MLMWSKCGFKSLIQGVATTEGDGRGEDPALELLGLGLNWLILFVMWPCLVDAECVRGNNRLYGLNWA